MPKETRAQGTAGEELRAWRKLAKLSQAAVAERIGRTRHYVVMLEAGYASPGIKTAIAIEALTGGRVACRLWHPKQAEVAAA